VEGGMSDAPPKDPLAFSFGLDFVSSADRIKGERDERAELVRRALPFGIDFLDDILRGILPNHLILLGAETGAGKTQTAVRIATHLVSKGKRVHYFALEAEPKEIERRIKHGLLASADPGRAVSYTDWYWGASMGELRFEEAEALRNLKTYYRGRDFQGSDIDRLFLAIQSETDLIILDHLHYVDVDEENENRGYKRLMKNIRDGALGIGRPVIAVAHVRKKDVRSRQLVPDMDAFHGSSDIGKIATHAFTLAPARSVPSEAPHIANTFASVPKDRMSGSTGYVALLRYDRNLGRFLDNYTLGRQSGDEWKQLAALKEKKPRWAARHQTYQAPNTAPLMETT
jgi:hypothetical protein